MLLETSVYKQMRRPGVIAKDYWRATNVEIQNDQWTVFSVGTCAGGRIDFESLAKMPSLTRLSGFTECIRNPNLPLEKIRRDTDNAYSLLSKTWREISDCLEIPYDLEERMIKFANVYSLLKEQIDYYEQEKVEKNKKGS